MKAQKVQRLINTPKVNTYSVNIEMEIDAESKKVIEQLLDSLFFERTPIKHYDLGITLVK